MGRQGDDSTLSSEDYLSPFAPPARGNDAAPPALLWEEGPFAEAAEVWLPTAGQVESEQDEIEQGEAVGVDEMEEEGSEAEALEEENVWRESEEESPGGGVALSLPESTFEATAGQALEAVLGQVAELTALSERMEQAGQQFEGTPATEADITDVFNLGKGIGRLGQGISAALSAGPPSSASDSSVAVPEFSFLARLSMPAPLLSAAANARAIQWNARQHPATSGVELRDIRADIARYVNLTVVAKAIQDFNTANPAKAIQLGVAPLDAVLVEALHQFQAKCFFETSQVDGMAGESTLDSLGLVKRTGMNSVDRRNAGAHARLGKVDVAGLTSNEFTADTWFNHMVNPTFLGWRFTTGGTARGVHLSFVRKLRIAERALLSLSKFSGKTPVELGKALGFDATNEEHKGARPTVTGASMHTYGLAVDIRYTSNPWVRGANFLLALKHSALLVSGVAITQASSQQFLHDLGSSANLTTAAIFDLLSQRDRDFREYLSLAANLAGLTAVLQARRQDGTAGVFTSASEPIASAAQRWRTHVQSDLANMRAKGSPFRSGTTRDPLQGFLNLDRDLVIALRDAACLAWGAVDIGSGNDGSGDMMHFDDRICGIGRELADVGGNTRPRSGHPCVACAPLAPVAVHEDRESFEDGAFARERLDEEEEEGESWESFDQEEAASERHESDEFESVDAIGELEEYLAGGPQTEPEEAWTEADMEEEQESFVETLGRLLNPGAIASKVQELLGAGLFTASLLSRFGSGQIWNEDHLALEVLFERQPQLRPADLAKRSGLDRLQRLRALAIKHQRELQPIREGVVRPIFGRPANFQIGPAEGCNIQDRRAEVLALGPLKAGLYKGQVYYKRAAGASPRKQAAVDSIVLHHMAYNIGNDVRNYLKVGAHYSVLADGQIVQLYDDLDFMNASDGFNARSVAIEFAGNFSSATYHWWKDRDLPIPDRCYLTPAQIRAGRCLVAAIKARLPGVRYIYAHRQSSKDREGDPGPDVWFNVGQWSIDTLGLTDRLPQTHIGTGNPIPDSWRAARPLTAVTPLPSPPVPAPRKSTPPVPTTRKVVVTVKELNVRSSPSVQGVRIGSLGKGEVVDRLDVSADGQWLKIQRGSLVGWSFGQYLAPAVSPPVTVTPPAMVPVPVAPSTGALDPILKLAASSPIARYRWRDRGIAPPGYIKGMALVYARVYCKLKRGDPAAVEMAKGEMRDALKDGLAHYAPEFRALGMSNSSPGVDTLRHLFVLLIGLGMRESSGRYCEGRDRSASNTTAETAEAGLFQTSYNARTAHAVMPQLFRQYGANPAGFLDVFQEGVRCTAVGLENFGSGDGKEFQRLSKACPAFAAEFAAVGLRNRRRHWGPINRKGAEIRPECDALLLQVQKLVDAAGLCPALG